MMNELSLTKILEWANTPFFHIGATPVTLSGVFSAFLVIVVSLIVSAFVQHALLGHLRKKFQLESGTVYAVKRIAHYVIIVIGFMIAVQCVGLNLGSVAVVFGFLSVGIGFGLQNITSNFISGIILLFERPMSVGDFVKVDDQIGRVLAINMRSTLIRTWDNVSIIVPNSKFIEEAVTNWSHLDLRVRLHCPVGVAYGSDLALVKQTLLQVAGENKSVRETPAPEVRFLEFGDSSLNFDLLVWLNDPENQLTVKSQINFAIDAAFRKRNIKIPFPQRDLHLQMTPAVEKLST